MLQRSRSVAAGLALGGLISTQLHSNTHAAAAAAAAEGNMRFGSKECPLDISVLWTAELDSPVYSTPVILPSSAGSRKQVPYAQCTRVRQSSEYPTYCSCSVRSLALHGSDSKYCSIPTGVRQHRTEVIPSAAVFKRLFAGQVVQERFSKCKIPHGYHLDRFSMLKYREEQECRFGAEEGDRSASKPWNHLVESFPKTQNSRHRSMLAPSRW